MSRRRSKANVKARKRRAVRRARDEWPVWYPGKKPRLYLDASVPESFVDYLSGCEVDAVHATASGLSHSDDIDHWDEARRAGRFLGTADDDFWDDQEYPLHESPGTVVLDSGSKQEWRRALTLLLGFVPHLKAFVTGPGAGDLPRNSKIRLTARRIVWRMRDRHSQIVTFEKDWGPWW